ncbi:hypothetical protein THAOC_22693 [Thalassiosira oceanica]|uniref:Uncharacterized protein n=1 Tax=Thalassiosira oceanica TaxID=159749 RepID=K0RWC0_THAOC|nr:hypothetical protein THAOC_22693 [Thalassiosira oceanica]|mmetsp:Transcript_26816/g.63612  ORF Transcript_26816/g.63612 Transcript_26816/m.63612 type:complete len:463 (-) Transcript_26816:355-1743(-)|eukprot:EJK57280.1 hypothetical protein THAOC_22693 [Thalassiosira oceanica]
MTDFLSRVFAIIPSDSDSEPSRDQWEKTSTKSRSKSKNVKSKHRRSSTPLSSSDYSSTVTTGQKSRKNGKHNAASKHPNLEFRRQHANNDKKETSSRRWRSKFKSKNRTTGADNCRRAPERTGKRKMTKEQHGAPPTRRDPINVGDSIFISQKFLEDCEVSVLTMPKELVGLSEDAINYDEVAIDVDGIVEDMPPPPPLRHDTPSSASFAADPPGYVGTALLCSEKDTSAKANKPSASNKTVSFAALPSLQHREEKFPFIGPSRDMYFVEHEMRSTLLFIPELFSSIEGDSTYTRDWEPGDRLLGEGKRGLRLSEELIDFVQSSGEVGPPSQENIEDSDEISSHAEATERLNESKVTDYRHRSNWKSPMLSYRPSKYASIDSWQVTLEKQTRTDAAIVIQSIARSKICRMLANKAEKGAVVIQRLCRAYIFRTRFNRSVKVRRSYSSSKWERKFFPDQNKYV